MTATLRVRRQTSFSFELRRGRFEVLLDGAVVGVVERQGSVEVAVEPGQHTLRIRAGRYSSREQAFEATDSGVVNFVCHGAQVWPTYVASFLKPDLAISLKRG